MKSLQENHVDLTPYASALIASLDEDIQGDPNIAVLVQVGAPAVKPLLDALRTSKAKWRMLTFM